MASLSAIVFTDVFGSSLTKRDVSLGRDNRERDATYLEKIQKPHYELIDGCYPLFDFGILNWPSSAV